MTASRAGVFLDRDGVLNRAVVRDGVPHPPDCVEQIEILPGVAQALAELAARGIPLIVVTNQPDVSRGTQTRQRVEQINSLLRERLPLTAVYTCYHDTADNCSCRKPKAGMLKDAAAALGIDLGRSFMVGDRWSDVAAGQAVGCTTFLIEMAYSQSHRCAPDYRVHDLAEAAQMVLRLIDQRTRQVGVEA